MEKPLLNDKVWKLGVWRPVDTGGKKVLYTTPGTLHHWRYYKFDDLGSLDEIKKFVERWGWEYMYTCEYRYRTPKYDAEFKRSPTLKDVHVSEPQWDAREFRIPNVR